MEFTVIWKSMVFLSAVAVIKELFHYYIHSADSLGKLYNFVVAYFYFTLEMRIFSLLRDSLDAILKGKIQNRVACCG